jgi:YheC/D like ATP-grasp
MEIHGTLKNLPETGVTEIGLFIPDPGAFLWNRIQKRGGAPLKPLPYQQVASKSLKTMVLMTNHRIRPYIPETRRFSPRNLVRMLTRHTSLFVKPDKGGGGAGAVRLLKRGWGKIEIRTLNRQKVIEIGKLFHYLNQCMHPEKNYIIQQGIDLGEISGRPFDLRVHLQKPFHRWHITGVCAKVAAPGKIVTNHCKGGLPVEAKHALFQVAGNPGRTMHLMNEIQALSKETARTLNAAFPGLKELGIDLGVDKNLRIWIFEVNTRPDFKMFRSLNNSRMYRRILKNHALIV